jgi:hypothetical protein
MCSNATYNKVCTGKNLSDAFPVQNGLKNGDALSPLLFICALEGLGKSGGTGIEWNT